MCDCRRTDVHLRGSKKIKINVIPETAKIYIDGQLVGEGTYQVKFEKGVDFYVVKAEAPGYITRTYRLLKSNPKNTVLYVLPEDDAFNSSIGSEDGNDIANRWFEVTCRKDMSEDVVWKRLISVCTNYFDNIEVRDKTAGWIKTQWHTDPLRNTTVRTRLEVRMQFKDEDVLAYRVRISVEKKTMTAVEGTASSLTTVCFANTNPLYRNSRLR